jgi:hypothetical protein
MKYPARAAKHFRLRADGVKGGVIEDKETVSTPSRVAPSSTCQVVVNGRVSHDGLGGLSECGSRGIEGSAELIKHGDDGKVRMGARK